MSESRTSELTVCGMPLRCSSKDEIAQPADALVILKTLESDGSVVHRVLMTEGLSHVEALGYVALASIYLSAEVASGFTPDDGDPDLPVPVYCPRFT